MCSVNFGFWPSYIKSLEQSYICLLGNKVHFVPVKVCKGFQPFKNKQCLGKQTEIVYDADGEGGKLLFFVFSVLFTVGYAHFISVECRWI